MLDKILDLLEKQVEPWIHPLRNNADFWYFVALLLAALLFLAFRFREAITKYLRREVYLEHDKALFQTLRSIAQEFEVSSFGLARPRREG
jgi:hypothetical protein